MSLSSTMPSAGRPLQEQAVALVAFLAARDNILTVPQASSALEGLPAEPKPAAKELRGRLRALGVDIQHTHALKAVAEARSAAGFLGLGEQMRYDVASWSPDAAGISCERVSLPSFAAAADEVCRRVREQYEDDAPLVTLFSEPGQIQLSATSQLTGSRWQVLLVPLTPDGEIASFAGTAALGRFAERLKRLVEGQLAGWVDGIYDVPQALVELDETSRAVSLRHESDFWNSLSGVHEGTQVADLPQVVPPEELWSFHQPLTQPEWNDFRKRYTAFARRHPDTTLFTWARELDEAAKVSRFEPVGVNTEALERARLAAGLSWDSIGQSHAFQGDDDGSALRELQAGRADLSRLQHVASLVNVDPNELLAPTRSTPRIPLPHHTDLALWLSRMDAVVSQPEGSPRVAAGLVNRLKALCSVPYEQRRHWGDRPPADFEALNQEVRFAGLMVCAGMGTRFVQDLPNGWARPASISVLEFDTQVDVLTQGGQLDPANTSMVIGPERDSVTPEWLARFNKPRFTASDLLRYSDMVHETIQDEDDEKERFTAKVFAGVKVFNRDPEKAHSAAVRMEALSRLIKDGPMEPWVRKSRDNPEDASLMISEAAFEAAARCELVDAGGEAGFGRQAFYMLCVQHARKYS